MTLILRPIKFIWDLIWKFPLFIPARRRSCSHRSIVRIIGTMLPLSPPPRVYFSNISLEPPSTDVKFECACCLEVKQINECNKTLKEEVDKLKEMISVYILDNEHRPTKVAMIPVPPPLPEMTVVPEITPVQNTESKNEMTERQKLKKQLKEGPTASLELVLSQLTTDKPHLRPIDRTPGGRPVRRKRSPEVDPSNVLSLILKKRYTALHASSESLNTSLGEWSSSPQRVCA